MDKLRQLEEKEVAHRHGLLVPRQGSSPLGVGKRPRKPSDQAKSISEALGSDDMADDDGAVTSPAGRGAVDDSKGEGAPAAAPATTPRPASKRRKSVDAMPSADNSTGGKPSMQHVSNGNRMWIDGVQGAIDNVAQQRAQEARERLDREAQMERERNAREDAREERSAQREDEREQRRVERDAAVQERAHQQELERMKRAAELQKQTSLAMAHGIAQLFAASVGNGAASSYAPSAGNQCWYIQRFGVSSYSIYTYSTNTVYIQSTKVLAGQMEGLTCWKQPIFTCYEDL